MAGLPRKEGYNSLTLYSVDVAGQTDVQLRYELQDGSTGTVNSTIELAPGRVILADTALGRMCEQLVFELGRRYLSLQSAYDTGSYGLIVEQVEKLEGELSSFETDLRGELDRFSADPSAYGG